MPSPAACRRTLLVALMLVGPAANAEPRRDEVVSMVERVKAAVVNIHSERLSVSDDPFGRGGPQKVNGMGTGIVLDPRGYIVTNFHVVDDVQSLRVKLSGGDSCPARVVALDKEADLAIIKIEPPSPLPVVRLGTASDLLLAERVIAIGNAYGYEHTVTVGTVSSLKRDVTLNKEVSYRALIQTQTPINPGNSGGPLFNKLGEVVGVNVAIHAKGQNIAFAIPIDTVIARAAEMLSARRRGTSHGLVVEDLASRAGEESALARSVRVMHVEPGSAADLAGARPGDVLERVADVPVFTSIDLERGFLDRPTGEPVTVAVRRGGSAVELKLALGSAGGLIAASVVPEPRDSAARKLGVRFFPVGPGAVAAANLQLRGGLLIQELVPGGVAASSGLRRGDILIGLHQWESLSTDNVQFVLNHQDLPKFAPLKAFVVRDGAVKPVVLSGLE